MIPHPDQFDLMGLRFDALTQDRCVAHVTAALDAGRGGVIVTANLDHLRRAQTDLRYRRIARQADLVVADGMPIVWASRLAGTPAPERIAGATLMLPLLDALGRRSGSVYLLGGNPGVADAAAAILASRCPGLRVAGTRCPEPGFETRPGEIAAIAASISAADPDLVLLALGSPKQEYAIDDLRACAPRAWWVGIGIGLSFLTGDVARAPGWMQRAGMEWAFRLAAEPRRLARRYLLDGLPFAARLGVWAVRARFGRSPARRGAGSLS